MHDLSTIFSRVRLTVAPFRFGAGVQGTVLDSLAAGVPCVMSPVAAEGIPLPPLLQPFVAADAEGIAAAICRLHEDLAANDAVADAGQDLMRTRFNAEAVRDAMAVAICLAGAGLRLWRGRRAGRWADPTGRGCDASRGLTRGLRVLLRSRSGESETPVRASDGDDFEHRSAENRRRMTAGAPSQPPCLRSVSTMAADSLGVSAYSTSGV